MKIFKLLPIIILYLTGSNVFGMVSGVVFRDFNANGIESAAPLMKQEYRV